MLVEVSIIKWLGRGLAAEGELAFARAVVSARGDHELVNDVDPERMASLLKEALDPAIPG